MPLTKDLTKFTTAGGPIISTNGTDLAGNIGTKTYNAGGTLGATQEYILSDIDFYGNVTSITESGTATNDIDFDITMSGGITFNGESITNVSWTHTNDTGSTTDVTTRVKILIKKYDGTTETTFGSEEKTTTSSSIGVGVTKYFIEAFKINLSNAIISKGEILRVTLEFEQITGNGSASVYFDPKNRGVTSDLLTTQLKVNLPVQILE